MGKYYLANGIEPDGIKYEVYVSRKNLLCNVTYKDKILTKEWPYTYEPRAGFDAFDVAKAEEVMEELINEMREKWLEK